LAQEELASYEMNFSYKEERERKNALVRRHFLIELMTSDRKYKASAEGAQRKITGPKRLDDT